jgi:hypothetical protein
MNVKAWHRPWRHTAADSEEGHVLQREWKPTARLPGDGGVNPVKEKEPWTLSESGLVLTCRNVLKVLLVSSSLMKAQ